MAVEARTEAIVGPEGEVEVLLVLGLGLVLVLGL